MNLRNRKLSSAKVAKKLNHQRPKNKIGSQPNKKLLNIPVESPTRIKLRPTTQAVPLGPTAAKLPIVTQTRNELAATNTKLKEKLDELFSNENYSTSYSHYLKSLFSSMDIPSKFRRRIKHFKRRKTKVYGPFNTYQMDLVDYTYLKGSNNGKKFLLLIIDCFSRFIHYQILKDKLAKKNCSSYGIISR